ncbi:MAG: phosphate acyltransferase, partial [Alphaproteobacteria bacterium]
DVALNSELRARYYPFSHLTEAANVLVMPALDPAKISSKLLQELGGGTVIGPLLIGLEKPAQIMQMGSTVTDIVNIAVLASHDAIDAEPPAHRKGRDDDGPHIRVVSR